MDRFGEWQVYTAVSGAITVKTPTKVEVVKGYHHPFLTTMHITEARNGVNIQLGATGRSAIEAQQSAMFFVGEALNVLGLRLNAPLYLSLADIDARYNVSSVRRVLNKEDWAEIFTLGRKLGQKTPAAYSRALSWYRKGLNSEDPIDKILAFWLSLEVVADTYGSESGKKKSPIANKIKNCCVSLWGEPKNWPVLNGDVALLQDLKDTRNHIAHGNFRIDPETISRLAEKSVTLQVFAHQFLTDWEQLLEPGVD